MPARRRHHRLGPAAAVAPMCVAVAGLCACGQSGEPPGRHVATTASTTAAALELPPPAPTASASAAANPAADEPGHGARVASIAMRTWVYSDPTEHAQKLGYLRAGAVIDRAERSAGNDGCKGGWYRVAPRGYVCLGKGASLDLEHDVVKAALHGPRRGQPTPYSYVMSRFPPPHLYYKLASEDEQKYAEGKRRQKSISMFAPLIAKALGEPDPIPAYLAEGKRLPKPYGAPRPLSYASGHRGRANEESAFGLIAQFEWTGRRMGLTTELDLIPLDRTKLAKVSQLSGLRVAPDEEGIPAIVDQQGVQTYEMDDLGMPKPVGRAPARSGWLLTGVEKRRMFETTKGVWLPKGALRVAKLREDPSGFAKAGRKWIDVSIKQQLLVAYEGKRPVYATLISSGRGGMSDPEDTHATVRGTFMIHAKHVSATMDGEDTNEDAFDLRDVPYIQYFYKGYALHGAYWHDDFGKVRSHGCVNLAPADAAWLFDWTEPPVPPGWHGALNHAHGTLVYIHR